MTLARSVTLAAVVLIGGVSIAACGSVARPAAACAKGTGSKTGGVRPASPAGGGRPTSPAGGKTGGASTPSAPKTTPAPTSPRATTKDSVDRSKTPDPPAYPAGGGAQKTESHPLPPRPRDDSATNRARQSSHRLAPLNRDDYDDARAVAPTRITRIGIWHSPITNIDYSYHDLGWYQQRGRVIDLYDPYDRYNHWYRPMSPFYGLPYDVAADCDGHEEQTEQPVNVNVVVNNDGVVTGTVPAAPPATTADTTPGTTPGSAAPDTAPPSSVAT